MTLLLKLAFLNVQRNPRRSLITIVAVSVGLAALIFLWGFLDGYQDAQRDNAIRAYTGHVQIHATGFQKKFSPELVLANFDFLQEKIKSDPAVVNTAPRIKCKALIGTSKSSEGLLLMGIDPDAEARVTDFKKYVIQGEFLSSGGNRDVVIGKPIAEKLEVGLGDKVVVMTQAMDGTLAGYAYRVKGILEAKNDFLDSYTAYVTLASTQELLGIENGVHELVVRLTGRPAIPSFLKRTRAFLDPKAYESITWDEIFPWINQFANWSQAITGVMMFAIMIVIGVGIMNTVLMSIFERTKEFGVMMAIGTKPGQIVSLVFLETIVLETLGVILGIGIGYLLTFYFGTVGIYFHGFEEAAAATFMSPVVYPQLKLHRVIGSVALLSLITTFIGFYPAWKAGRMEPVKAIYHS